MWVLPLLVAMTVTTTVTESDAPAPAYLPRSFYLGVFDRGSEVTAQVRLQWQFPLVRDEGESFSLIAEGGGGYGLAGPLANATLFYETAILVGPSFCVLYGSGFNWAVQLATGPVLYGARNAGQGPDLKGNGFIEGRAEAGFRTGAAMYGVVLGYAVPYVNPPSNLSGGQLLGGLTFGIFLDW